MLPEIRRRSEIYFSGLNNMSFKYQMTNPFLIFKITGKMTANSINLGKTINKPRAKIPI